VRKVNDEGMNNEHHQMENREVKETMENQTRVADIMTNVSFFPHRREHRQDLS